MITRELIASLNFRQFTKNDFYGFSGVESPIPLIAEDKDREIVMVIDGDNAELYQFNIDGSFECIDSTESIRELPYKTEKQIRIEAEIAKMEEAIVALKAELN